MLRCLMSVPVGDFQNDVNNITEVYGYFLNDNKEKEFGLIDTLDTSDEVGQYLESCDYRLVMQALNPSSSCFADFEDVLELSANLSDPNDIVGLVPVLSEEFIKMPKEVKEHYDNNYNLFARDLVCGGFATYVNEKYGGDKSVAESVADSLLAEQQRDGNGTDIERLNELAKQFEDLQRKIDTTSKQGGQE